MHDAELEAYLIRLGLLSHRVEIRQMLENAPARVVGARALNNTIVHFQSRKNDDVRILESHTVERLFAYELEFDDDVLAYFCQAACTGIEGRTAQGKRHVTVGTVDFMVLRTASIELVECKTLESIRGLVSRHPHSYVREVDGFTRPAYADWAARRGMRYRIWHPPQHDGVRLRNLEALYTTLGSALPSNRVIVSIRDVLDRTSCSISQLLDLTPNATPYCILRLLAAKEIFGPTELIPLDDVDRFLLSNTQAHADIVNERLRAIRDGTLTEAHTALSQASRSEIEAAVERLDQVRRFQEGTLPGNRRILRLSKRVNAATLAGHNPLLACLINHRSRGNRIARYPERVYTVIDDKITKFWDTGKATDQNEICSKVAQACEAEGLPVPGTWLVKSRIRARSRTARDLATGGQRKYHAHRSHSSPLDRAGEVVARGTVLHIDSTLADHRSLTSILGQLVIDRPTIYIGVDGASKEVMADAIGFGAASRWGLALLLRDYVRKHGFLPHIILLDRGPEFTGPFLLGLCRVYGIQLHFNATANSRANSEVENFHGLLTNAVFKVLPGSAHPDRANRAVSNQFKSQNTARLHFDAVREAVHAFAYGDNLSSPRADGLSPQDHRDGPKGQFGLGIPCDLDELFLFLTSIPTSAKSIDERNRIHLGHANFTSAALAKVKRLVSKGIDVRLDPENSSIARIRHAEGITRAYGLRALRTATLDAQQGAFDSMTDAERRRAAVSRRSAIRRERAGRNADIATTMAKFVTGSTTEPVPSVSKPPPHSEESNSTGKSQAALLQLCFDNVADLEEAP